ncbi:hypothetical protein [Paraburkholderia sp. MM5477-R1]|uniref:hypothetical protein n=1 Tax=Paraburkholderia sp. MM5477-R1 TaxID=2991062 RepID=UPI003D2628F9
MDKFIKLAVNVVVIAICVGLAYGFYKVFDAETHDVIEQIQHGGLRGLSLQDKIWLMELLGTYVFLAMLTMHHFLETIINIKAIFDDKEVKESNLLLHAYGFFAVIAGSMIFLIVGSTYAGP